MGEVLFSRILEGQVVAARLVVLVVRRPEGGRAFVVELAPDAARTGLGFLPALGVKDGAAAVTSLGGVLLKRVEHLSALAEFTDEAFLSTQAAAEDVCAGELYHFGQERSQFAVDHLHHSTHRTTSHREDDEAKVGRF